MPMTPVELPVSLDPVLRVLDLAGIAVFALTGALVAASRGQTLVTFLFFAVVTAVGGGTARDLIIDAPVFWLRNDSTLLICFGAALAVWLLPRRIWDGNALLWFDAIGLAVYASYGAAKALAYGLAPLPAFAMGVLTGCAGGIIRDVLAGQPSILMRPELYVTAGALSAALFVGFSLIGVPDAIGGPVAALAGFALRGAAIRRGWSLPAYRA